MPTGNDPVSAGTRPCVLLLVSTLGVGGAERHTITLANLMQDRFDVLLVSLKRGTPADEAMAGHVDRRGLRALDCLEVGARFDAAAARRLAALVREHKVRVILCTNAYPLLYAQWARWWLGAGAKVVEVYHTTVVKELSARLQLLFYRPFFWTASGLVFVCHAQRRFCTRRGIVARRMEVIHNGVDLRRFSGEGLRDRAAVRAAHGFGPDDRVVGVCAVFRPEKAHPDLLEAVAMLKRRGIAWKVLLIGDGPERPRIEAAVDRLGLREDVRITGFLADVREQVHACDVIALVSTAIETFSIAALEAMALGRALLMSEIGGAAEQVSPHVNGLLFPPGDVPALAACLEEMADPALTRSMGQASRERVAREFSQETMLGRYVELVDSLG